jgi:hypothetical protein
LSIYPAYRRDTAGGGLITTDIVGLAGGFYVKNGDFAKIFFFMRILEGKTAKRACGFPFLLYNLSE